ncbi:glycosyltransferase [Cyanobium sp. ATX 6F1]|uniref:glycosyltransferase n=1 Tax=unclassified Cyanobium TaxID=2627006 RepID=UPI0020CD4A69|nr:glycosyltransferase [Cyanobium sp. ATX 6F1]MCP9916797.1 glycosyltransferase [Cyanobium sp. ATX 6F1]
MQHLIIDFSYAKDGGYLKGTFQYGIELAKSLSMQVLPFPIECVVSGPANAAYLSMRLSDYDVSIRSIQLPQMLWCRYLSRQIYFMRNGKTDNIVISIGSCGVFGSAHNVVVINDLYWQDMPRVYRFSQYLYYKLIVAANLRWADLLLVTTFTNKNRVDQLRSRPAATSFVLYYLLKGTSRSLGIAEDSQMEKTEFLERSEFSILTVAANTANKNLSGVLAAYRLLLRTDSRWQLTIVTDAANAVQELARPLSHGLRVLERVSEAELLDLYRKNSYYWQLSFVEGFGLPLIEALNENCRIICSDLPVFREILGDAASYVNPSEPDSVAYLCQHWPRAQGGPSSQAVFKRMEQSNRSELGRLTEQLRLWHSEAC